MGSGQESGSSSTADCCAAALCAVQSCVSGPSRGRAREVLDGTSCLLVGCMPYCVGPHPFSRLLESRRDSEVGVTLSWSLNLVVLALVRFLLLLPTYFVLGNTVQGQDAQLLQCLSSETKWRLADIGWGIQCAQKVRGIAPWHVSCFSVCR